MEKTLKGKTAFIIGGSGGLGREIRKKGEKKV